MARITLLIACFLAFSARGLAQPDRWQQKVRYEMDIDFDVSKHQFKGYQKLTFFNESPDSLDRVYYHLYFNAFQPGSAMDVRSQNLPDPDFKVADRISQLKPEEQGYQRVNWMKQDGAELAFETVGTILEVKLAKPIPPHSSTVLEMAFDAQVPVQIRRSGRDNSEGVAYSMSQWYPKLCNYDYQGWHANPYIAREFYGIWGDFSVRITIDPSYIIGATGYLQNPQEIGHGYEEPGTTVNRPYGARLTWNFWAPNVHDFIWGADPDYTHTNLKRADGVTLHFFYQKNSQTEDNWERLPAIMDKALDFLNENYGNYPYEQYSFIQGGDGGMEYPMATLITGNRQLASLAGVSVHEMVHSWFQSVLGSNESLYAWMDEGFTSYVSSETMNHLRKIEALPGSKVKENPHLDSYFGYFNLVESGLEEPLSTHADHFQTNFAYWSSAYSKGAVFLGQLSYIMGREKFAEAMLQYYDTWKFKHPNANDFIRIMERVSGLELDWYREYWVNSTHTVDYGVTGVEDNKRKTSLIRLERLGAIPMPVDLVLTLNNGEMRHYSIPLDIMRGAKTLDNGVNYTVAPDWQWVNPAYELKVDIPISQIKSVSIDPTSRMADVNSNNNRYTIE